MAKPYTYLLHCKPTNQWYYGVRWANVKVNREPIDDLWLHYFTTSKLVKALIEQFGSGPDIWEYEIRQTFETVHQAREWEHKVLRRMRVLEKLEQWLNRTDNRAIKFDVHPRGTLGKRYTRTAQAKERMSVAKRGKSAREIWGDNCDRMSRALKDWIVTDEGRHHLAQLHAKAKRGAKGRFVSK